MKVEYSSNNSGGNWWLKDSDWVALEKAGWFVVWGGDYFCHSKFNFADVPVGKPQPCAKGACRGHRRFDSFAELQAAGKDGRWLGAAAREATKDFASLRDAIVEWESVTGQNATDEGCNCCGAPHSFSAEGEYASGDSVVGILYTAAPTSLREAAERLAR